MATLADALRGYVPPTDSPMSDVVTNYANNIAPQAQANLLRQAGNVQNAIEVTPDLHLQVKDPQAFNQFMSEIPNLANMVAYHGTPHEIQGAFDISKVGTGEGNQSFGHGMYFAENPAVAGEYARKLAEKPKDVINGYINYSAKYGRPKGEGNTSIGYLQSQGYPTEYAPLLDKIIAGAKIGSDGNVNFSNSAIKYLSNLDSSLISEGNLYKVDIPDEHIPLMLDWDKPISKQTELIKNVAQELLPNIQKTSPSFNLDKATGADFYRAYTRHKGNYPDFASEALLEKGIKGIKYKDEKSRYDWVYSGDPAYTHAGNSFKESGYTPEQALEGMKQAYKNASSEELQNAINDVYGIQPPKTHNFVVFEPSTVQILEKNGKPTRKDIIEQQVNKVLE
jgi:hypothetical protein